MDADDTQTRQNSCHLIKDEKKSFEQNVFVSTESKHKDLDYCVSDWFCLLFSACYHICELRIEVTLSLNNGLCVT